MFLPIDWEPVDQCLTIKLKKRNVGGCNHNSSLETVSVYDLRDFTLPKSNANPPNPRTSEGSGTGAGSSVPI